MMVVACNHARNSKADRGKLPISPARFLIVPGIMPEMQSTVVAAVLTGCRPEVNEKNQANLRAYNETR